MLELRFYYMAANVSVLFIRTPLQAMIVYNLLYTSGAVNVTIYYLVASNKECSPFIIDLLSDFDVKIISKYGFSGLLGEFFWFLGIKKTLEVENVAYVYISSFDSPALRRISKSCRSAKLITFDDGTGYLNKQSSFFTTRNQWYEHFKSSLFLTGTRISFLENIHGHITIYPEDLCLIKHVPICPINFVIPSNNISLNIKDIEKSQCSVFIGTVLQELKSTQKRKIERVIEEMKIDYFIKHPRDFSGEDYGIRSLKFEIPAECLIKQLSEIYSLVTVYSWSSSVFFNINISNVKKIAFVDFDDIKMDYVDKLCSRFEITVMRL